MKKKLETDENGTGVSVFSHLNTVLRVRRDTQLLTAEPGQYRRV